MDRSPIGQVDDEGQKQSVSRLAHQSAPCEEVASAYLLAVHRTQQLAEDGVAPAQLFDEVFQAGAFSVGVGPLVASPEGRPEVLPSDHVAGDLEGLLPVESVQGVQAPYPHPQTGVDIEGVDTHARGPVIV